MFLRSDSLYHLYNQGNNRRNIFFSEGDFRTFIQISQTRLLPFADVLAWCLMPNHFHLLIRPLEGGLIPKKVGNLTSTAIANGMRLLQSQYGQYLNSRMGWSGSVFRQKPRWMEMATILHSRICFRYIHQNPVRSQLVLQAENWPFSSLHLYGTGIEDRFCCNPLLTCRLLDRRPEELHQEILTELTQEELAMVRPVFT